MFARLGEFCVRRRGWVVVAWVVVLVLGGAATGAVGDDFRSEFGLPDVESKAGFDILQSSFGGQGAGETGNIVFESTDGFSEAERAAAAADRADPKSRDLLAVVARHERNIAEIQRQLALMK